MSDLTIGANLNTHDTADVKDGITLNPTTSVKIADANPNRIFFHVNTDFPEKSAYIKLQAADVDDDQKGIFLNEKEKGVTQWEMPSLSVYTGEISAIAVDGNPIAFVTEY